MLYSQNFQVALRALLANKMRSLLTMLGIVIGVAAVVALLAIGNGATNSITSEVQGAGSNLISIMPGKEALTARSSGASTSKLFYDDYTVIKALTSKEATVSPTFQSTFPVKYASDTYAYAISGVNAEYMEIRAYEVASGRALTQNDCDSQAQVAVIGSDVSADLFGGINPVGKDIKINGIRFQVIGLLESKGSSGMENSDATILIPLETGYAKLFGKSATDNGNKTVSSIAISVLDPDNVQATMAKADYLLRRQHNIEAGEDADFSIMSQNDMLDMLGQITSILTIFLGAIAAISLLVGGIGIMNIMLVSVTERTREIGLRKAVGARKDQILVQFLIETMILSILGGLIGILFGVGIAGLVTVTNLIIAQVTWDSILLAFTFSAAVGLFFGLYPAYRAAGLHPMEALRYE